MNSTLYNNTYTVPENILEYISNRLKEYSNIECSGKKKANFILNEKKISYQNLKRYKNFFDYQTKKDYNLNSDDTSINDVSEKYEYELSGGDLMRKFVDETLEKERKKIEDKKYISTELGGMYNQYNKESSQDKLKINTDFNFIKESDLKLKKNNMKVSLTVIFNREGKILILKRSNNTNWCPNCWAIVGGKIEKKENPSNALVREVWEETGIKLNKFKFKKLIKNKDIIEYLYLSMVDNDFVELNDEHTEYKWATIEDIKKLDNKVPDLLEYIKYVII
jgi:8-oxo-dGTP diphosphatase